jgi:hypothetical protein
MTADAQSHGDGNRVDRTSLPPAVRWSIITLALTLIAASLYLWAVRGHAILLDLASSAVAFLCL